MRVLHIGKFFPPFAGGMEYFLSDLLAAMADRGVQSAALVHEHRRHIREEKPADYSRNPLIYRAPCYGRLLYAPISPSFPWWLARVIRDFKPDILHLHMPNTSAFWAMFVPTARRLPWVVHWHSDVVASQLDRRLALAYWLYRPFEQRLLAASHAIIVTSPPYLQSSLALERWRQKCHVIPLGIDPEQIHIPTPDTLQHTAQFWQEGTIKLLAIGRLTYYKGFEVLIQAVATIPELQLLIVGQGERRVQLEQLIQSLNLKDKILLTGALPDAQLNALWTQCDVFCLPSLERTEAFGLVLLEAMHFQKPVIVSDIAGSGMGWVVREAQQGLLVEPGNVTALSEAIMQLQQTPQQRLQFGQAGASALQKKFHIKRVAAQTLALYQQIYDSRH